METISIVMCVIVGQTNQLSQEVNVSSIIFVFGGECCWNFIPCSTALAFAYFLQSQWLVNYRR